MDLLIKENRVSQSTKNCKIVHACRKGVFYEPRNTSGDGWEAAGGKSQILKGEESPGSVFPEALLCPRGLARPPCWPMTLWLGWLSTRGCKAKTETLDCNGGQLASGKEGPREVVFWEGAGAPSEETKWLLQLSLPETIKTSMYEISLIL
jgi:hypothetical protein